MNIFKGRGRVIAARAIGAAIVIFAVGLLFGKLDEPYFFVGVFVMSNLFMLLDDILKQKVGKSFVEQTIGRLYKKTKSN